MARSLGLSTYLALARRESPLLQEISGDRPSGQVLWLHCADTARLGAIARLGQRLATQRPELSVILTIPPGSPEPKNLPKPVLCVACPSENPQDIRLFLDHWSPDGCLWLGPWLRPALIDAAARRNVPLALLDADEPGLENRRWRWVPEPVKATLLKFSTILAHSDEALPRLRRMVGNSRQVQASGRLLEDSPALPCNDTDLEELTTTLAGRPVWLASQVQLSEIGAVLDAHRAVTRLSHRTLMILVPDNADEAEKIAHLCIRENWSVGRWDDGESPERNTQILISEDKRELGLWYRVAPITFMGSSLVSGQGGRNPLEPAALGSAVLYGPGVRTYLDSYSRLAQAGAARIVRDADSLISALSLVSAPDQAAAMAHAGWEVVSEGAEVSDQIIEIAQNALDAKGAD